MTSSIPSESGSAQPEPILAGTTPSTEQEWKVGYNYEQGYTVACGQWPEVPLGFGEIAHDRAKAIIGAHNSACSLLRREQCQCCGGTSGKHYPTCYKRESDLALALPADNIIGTPDGEPASLEWYAEKFSYQCGYPLFTEMLRNYAAIRRGWRPQGKEKGEAATPTTQHE